MSKIHSIPQSFSYAYDGIKETLKNEPNFKIQIILALLAIAAAIYLQINYLEWIILILTIFLVLVLELINTAIEAIVDLVSPEITEKAKIAKDVAAAAVLISSIASIIVGAFIFLPKIFSL